MNISVADLLTLATVLVTLYIAISNGRKTRAEARASEATVVETYAEAATKMAQQSTIFQGDISALSKRLDARDDEIADLKMRIAQGNYLLTEKFRRISDLERRLDERDAQIADFGQRINELTNAHAAKDARIADLERLTAVQETEIQSLRAEVDVLRFKRK